MRAGDKRALALVVAAWDAANARNVERWRYPLRGGIDAASLEGVALAAIRRLARLALLQVTVTEISASRLRPGAYGRWIGGAAAACYAHVSVKPTLAGRDTV